ncbi:MAG: DMT family transporter [Rhodospirillales bacterium]
MALRVDDAAPGAPAGWFGRLPDAWVGRAAGFAAVLVWSAWLVSTRYGVSTTLGPADVAFVRYVVPALILFPVLLRHGLGLRRGERGTTLIMVAGAGIPFYLVAASGMQFAPMSHISALLPGTVALWTALIAAAALGERPDRGRLAGLALILAGVAAIGGLSLVAGVAGQWQGHLLLLLGAMMWSCYTVAMRRKATGAWRAAAIVNVYSALVFAPVYVTAFEPRLFDAPWRDVAIQVVAQGILSGVVAMILYGIAVRRLGAGRAAAFNALLPALATLLAVPALGELPDLPAVAGIVAVSLGVALATGTIAGRRARPE